MKKTGFIDIGKLITLEPLRLQTPRRRLALSDLGVIDDAAFITNAKGMIEWVGRRKDLPNDCDEEISLEADTVLPGFVDAHTHLLFAGDRADEFRRRAAGVSYQQIATEGGGILTTMNATRAAPESTLMELGRRRLFEALRFGVTTIEIKSGYALNEEGEKKLLRVASELQKKSKQKIVRTYLGAHAFPKDISQDAYIDFLCRSSVQWFKEGLYDQLDMFLEEGYFSAEHCTRFIRLAKENGIPFKIHADEFKGLGGARLGAKYKALSVDHLLHYLDGASEMETVEVFRTSGTVPMFLPGTAFFLKLPYANPLPFLNNGIPVALATDFNPGSCMSQNLPLMMNLAVQYMGMNVEEALAAVTIHGAKALAISDRGFLGVGAVADFQVLDVPFPHLAYQFGGPIAREIFLSGKKAFPVES